MNAACDSSRADRRALIAVLAAVALAGCFKDPKLDLTQPRHCQADDKSCPYGFVCGPDGLCCPSQNGTSCNVSPVPMLDGSALDSGRDGLLGESAGRDAPGIDGAGLDGALPVDLGSDLGSDVPQTSRVDAGLGGNPGSGGVTGAGGSGGMAYDVQPDLAADVPAGGGGSGGVTASGGVTTTGGASATGGVVATGGVSATGGVTGAGGATVTCTGQTKECAGTCIPTTSCCGACTGNTPICSNGTCVGRALGDACATGTECTSGVCADGVCCNVACGGQCESCAIAASKGTCVPTTTARTPCTGTGTCGGFCDGTAANRAKCFYPTAETSCGPSASCTSGQLTSAATCNGAGRCNEATTTPCTYGCRSDGTAACATSCPSGQGLCGGACVDIQGSAAHCGGSCLVCQGLTPKCAAGSCVECITDVDCASHGYAAACTTGHTCQCHPSHVGNLVQNPNFDTALGTGSWQPTAGAVFTANDDADACPDSGSIHTQAVPNTMDWGFIAQCVVASAATPYYLGYDYKQDSPSSGMCRVEFYAGGTCSGGVLASYSVSSSSSAAAPSWTWVSGSTTSPAGTGSARVACMAMGTAPVAFDQIYLNPSSVSY